MICKECGADVNSSEVFCPNCGAPLRVTADYDFIQAEIGVKVDQFLNDEPEITDAPDFEPDLRDPDPDAPELTIIGAKQPEAVSAQTIRIPKDPGLNIIGDPSSNEPVRPQSAERKPQETAKKNLENTISITRTLYVKDSIFADEDAPDFDDEIPERIEKSRRKTEAERSHAGSKDARKQRAKERERKKKRTIILVSVIAAVVLAAVIGIILITSGKKKEEAQADVITCSVENGGSYSTPLEVTLWSDQDSRLVYTLDGTEPGISTGTKYAQPIQFTNKDVNGESMEVTLIVFAYKQDASVKVAELRVTFTLTRSEISAPWMDLGSGDYYEPQFISIAADEGCTIYYTYDGSTPSENSTKYTGPIEMKRGNNVLSAIAVDDSGMTSEVSQVVYNLIIEAWISYDDALGIVMDTLVGQGLIEGYEADENGYYKVPGGGTRRVINGGEAVVDNSNYYVIQVDYMNDGSSVQATTYYGVNDQSGEVTRLNRSGMSFVIG